jgi:hypothetical protein
MRSSQSRKQAGSLILGRGLAASHLKIDKKLDKSMDKRLSRTVSRFTKVAKNSNWKRRMSTEGLIPIARSRNRLPRFRPGKTLSRA